MKNYFYGSFGGRYVPETLIPALEEFEESFNTCSSDPSFQNDLSEKLKNFVGRETPLYFAENLSKELQCKVYLKREDLCHTGAHKINNALGQALLAKRMGKEKVIAETGAGQHGVATATVAAFLGMECKIFMGEEDIKRQMPNVRRMNLLGAEVVPVSSGSRTLKDAVNEAMRYWTQSVNDTHYIFGSVLGPYPFPKVVAYFQSVIGREAKMQIMNKEGVLPDSVIACVGGGSNAMGIFSAFIDEPSVELIGVEAGGYGDELGEHAARFLEPEKGIFHGTISYLLQDKNGQIVETHSVSAGLDYPGVGPEHAHLYEIGRATYDLCRDKDALEAFQFLSKKEGIIPALESSHAVGYLFQQKEKLKGKLLLVNLSGRGDKDLDYVFGMKEF